MSHLTATIRPRGAQRAKALRSLLCDAGRFPFYLWLSALATFVVECLSRRSVAAAFLFAFRSPFAYAVNVSIVLLTLLPALLCPKRAAGVALSLSVWAVLGVTQFIVLLCRVTPFSAVDISILFSVITVVTAYVTPVQLALIGVGFAALVAGLVFLFIKTARVKARVRLFLVSFASVLLVCLAALGGGFATGQLSDRFPNLVNAYEDYGFPYCFTMSIVDRGVDKPDRYGQEMMSGILDRIPPEQRTDALPNVIFVQLESFFDAGYLENVTFSEDPTPRFTALREKYPSGRLTVPVVGAGTVNTEFEILTGMRVADFGAGEYPFRSVLREDTCESIAYDLRAAGLSTHAVHNHEGTFYFRNEVYRRLGFESFTPIEYFAHPLFNERGWALDRILTDEILCLLDSTDERDFVFAVSVQGHGRYPNDYVPREGDVRIVAGLEGYEATESQCNYFVSQTREMDGFIGDLYDAIMARDEPTALVFYGDHLPSLVRDEGLTLGLGTFETEYVIVTNYDPPVPLSDQPLAAYQVFPTVMEMIGCDTGVVNRFHRAYRDDPRYLSLLEALTYDVFGGQRLAYGDTVYPVMEDMRMGSRPIVVRDCRAEGTALLVKGENFTRYSTVYLDGHRERTEFLDASTLRVPRPGHLRGPDEGPTELTVRQLSARGETLSETAPFQARR